jgi:DNA-binding MarR family transcriptional regulator
MSTLYMLTPNQARVLRNLRDSKSQEWNSHRHQWLFDTPSGTIRILDALVKKGLVVKEGNSYRPTEEKTT